MRDVAGMIRICVTGPESTGKTTLATALAEALETEWVPEASRLHAEALGRALTAGDVEPIARRHLALALDAERRATVRGAQHVVLDTDLVSTLVYARHYYGTAPAWIVERERERRADLYLLCDIDVPWVADGVRDEPTRREALLGAFAAALAARDARVAAVRGTEAERLHLALRAVAALVTRPDART